MEAHIFKSNLAFLNDLLLVGRYVSDIERGFLVNDREDLLGRLLGFVDTWKIAQGGSDTKRSREDGEHTEENTLLV